jgi:hypothetical protein
MTDPFALARAPEADLDRELYELIAEEARLGRIGVDYRTRADEAMYALSWEDRSRLHQQYPEEEDLPEPFGSLYAEAQRYEEAANDACRRIAKPTTLAGVIALVDLCSDDVIEVDPHLEIAIAGLREIVKREAQS